MLRVKSNTDVIPKRIKDLLNRSEPCKSFLSHNRVYDNEEWYVFVSSCVDFVFNLGEDAEKTDALTAYIYNYFKERKLFPEFFEENIRYFEEQDILYYYDYILQIIDSLFVSNNYKYHGLFESTILEFNPLWNVDGVETTVRTLEQDGTIVTEDTGTDTTTHTGTDTKATTGTDTNKRTGTDTLAQTGTDATAHTGTETDTHTGTDANAHTGTQTLDRDASNADSVNVDVDEVASVTSFNDEHFMDTNKTIKNDDTAETHTIDETELTTFADTTTETRNLTDQTTFNDTVTETKNLSDARTYNLEDKRTANLQEQSTLNLTDELEKDTTSTTTRDLLDTERIILERHGNIGVVDTVTMLNRFREYVRYNFLDVVAHDVVDAISYMIY